MTIPLPHDRRFPGRVWRIAFLPTFFISACATLSAHEVVATAPSLAPAAAVDCFTSSLASGSETAWRCISDEKEILDPCFRLDKSAIVECRPNPVERKPGRHFQVSTFGDRAQSPLDPGLDVWLMRLEDGRICAKITGGFGIDDDGKYNPHFDCTVAKDSTEVATAPEGGTVLLIAVNRQMAVISVKRMKVRETWK